MTLQPGELQERFRETFADIGRPLARIPRLISGLCVIGSRVVVEADQRGSLEPDSFGTSVGRASTAAVCCDQRRPRPSGKLGDRLSRRLWQVKWLLDVGRLAQPGPP